MDFRYFKYCTSPLCILSFIVVLTPSCQLGPSYQTPAIESPSHWKTAISSSSEFPKEWKTDYTSDQSAHSPNSNQSTLENSQELQEKEQVDNICNQPYKQPLENWWQIFNNPVLNQLEEQAIASSYSLWAAMERVEQARALTRVVGAARWPLITFDPSFSRSGSLIPNPLMGGITDLLNQQITQAQAAQAQQLASSGQNDRVFIPRFIRIRNTSYTLPFNFSYEVDLWSRIRNMYEASILRAEAAQEAYENVLLSLTTDVAYHYFQLRGLDTQKVILEKNIHSRQQSYEINLARFEAGLSVYVDVTRAETQLATARAERANVIRQRGVEENVLAVLTGMPAPLFTVQFDPLDRPPPSIPLGLPSELLYRRPDVKEAERNLAAAYAEVGVAYANFYPSIILSATLGLESPDLSTLFDWQARLWAIGTNVTQTIFNAGRNSANLRYYISRYQELLDNYQQRILDAFRDVEDALVDLKWRAIQEKELDHAVRAAQQTLDLSQIRYTQGLTTYLEVADSERDVLLNERDAGIVLTERYLASVLLIRSLGGGWETASKTPCLKDLSFPKENNEKINLEL